MIRNVLHLVAGVTLTFLLVFWLLFVGAIAFQFIASGTDGVKYVILHSTAGRGWSDATPLRALLIMSSLVLVTAMSAVIYRLTTPKSLPGRAQTRNSDRTS